MSGKNWNSKTKNWSGVVRPETKAKAEKVKSLRASGNSIEQIAKELGLSTSRIRELLR